MSSAQARVFNQGQDSILEAFADGMTVLDQQWCVTDLNTRQAKWFGQPKAAVIGHRIWEICPAWTQPEIQQTFQQARTQKTPLQIEYYCPQHQAWFELRLSPWDGGMTIVLLEITPRKQQEATLQESAFCFEAFMNHSPVSAWIVNEAGRLLYLNPIYLQTFFFGPDAVGQFITDVFPPEIAQEFLNANQQVFETGKPLQVMEYSPAPDGTVRSFLVHKFPLKNGSGEKLLGGFAIDISEQKRIEAALRESEQHFKIALRTGKLGSWQHDLTTGVLTCSDPCKANFGLPPEAEFTHETLFAALHPDDRALVQQAIETSLRDRIDYAVEERCFHPDGSLHWLIARGGLVYDDQGNPIRLVGVTLDITEQKQFEESLKAANQQVSNILESITDAFIAFDQDWHYTYVNQEAAKLLGKSPAELLGKRWQDVFPELAAQGTVFTAQMERVMSDRITVHCEGYSQPIHRWLEASIFPASPGISVFFRDISQRKQEERRKSLQYTISQILSEASTLTEVVPTLLQTLCAELDWQVGMIWSLNRTQGQLQYVNRWLTQAWQAPESNQYGKIQPFIDASQHTAFEWGMGLPGRIWQYQQPIWIADLTQEQNFPRFSTAQGAGLKSGFGFPILLGEEFFGVIECFSDRIQDPDLDLLDLMMAIGRQIGQFMERKRTETALQESEELFQSFMTHSPVAAFMKDESGRYIYVNALVEKLFGRPNSQLVGYTDEDWFPAGAIEQIRANDAMVLAQNRSSQFLETVPCADQTYHFIAFKFPIQDRSGRRFLGGVSVDITDRIQAEMALREREEELRVITNAVPVLISFIDTQQRYRFNSQRYQEWFGRTPEEIQGKYLWEVVGDEAYAAVRPHVEQALSGQAVTFEQQMVYANGQNRHINASFVPLVDKQQQVTGFVALVSDITDRKQAEAEKELLLEREKTAREQAESANRIKDEFLAVLSHELRSPLNPILGWSKLLQRGALSEQVTRQALETIERNARLQTQLIDDLLDVSRILRGKMILNSSPVNLVAMVESALETMRLAAEAKQIQITTHLRLPQGQVLGDSTRLQQVVWNLLSNAVKFTPSGGRIDLCLTQVGTEAQIQVKDTGKGINPEFLPFVFDYFRQEDGKITRKFGGLGLGLAIVRHLTELHGGTVEAESLGEGQGATFTVRLPLIAAPQHPDETEEIAPPAPDLSQVRILVVDDDADMRLLTQAVLEQQQAQVTVAKSAAEVLDLFDQQPPDLFISDIGMPEMDGYRLMEQIRRRPPEQGGLVPAIALTAYAGEYDQQQALKVGFQRHIAKPIEPEILVQEIVRLIQRESS